MIVYYSFFVFTAIAGLIRKDRYQKLIGFAVIGVLLFLMAALRDGYIGKDYQDYINSFNEVGGVSEYFTNYSEWLFYEPFFYLLPAILKALNVPFFEIWLFFIFAALGVYFKLRGIWYLSSFVFLSLVHYFSNFFLLHEMTQIRGGVAAGLMLICVYYHYHRKYVPFFLYLLLALLFHYTALLILLILFLNPRKFSVAANMGLILASFVFGLLKINSVIALFANINLVFVQKLFLALQSIGEDQNVANTFNIGFVLNCAIAMVLIFKNRLLVKNNPYAPLAIKVHVMSIFLYGLFSSLAVLSFRLYEFFGVINIITVPLLVFCFRSKILGYAIVAGYSLLLLATNLHITKLMEGYKVFFL